MNTQSAIIESLQNSRQINESVDYDKLEKDIRSNAAYKRLKKLCNMYGYDCDLAYIRFSGNYYVLKFTPYVKDSTNKYLREIYLDVKAIGKDIKSATQVEVKAQTTSFGALNKEEFTKFSKSVEATMNLVHALSSFDYTKLEVVEVDEI